MSQAEYGEGRVLIKSRVGDSDLINVRIGPLCGLKSDISRGQRSANSSLSRCGKPTDHFAV
jgi:hypothetical protein